MGLNKLTSNMVYVEEARKILRALKHAPKKVLIDLRRARGLILAEDVLSPIFMPPFDQSAMDGFALKFGDSLSYQIIGEVQAGASEHPKMRAGDAVRIFTGAAVPTDADAVIMQEKTKVENGKLLIESSPTLGQNIRPLGEQIKKGDLALEAGTTLTAAAIGFLAGLGIQEVSVFEKPTIAIVVTGDELVAGGEELKRGQIYESNGIMLQTVVEDSGFLVNGFVQVGDNYQTTLATLKKQIDEHDFVIISGGISVGDYDFVGKALMELGVEQLFYKVRQKPGKPMFLGRKGASTIFALPGNPAAALSCYYQYVLAALKNAMGQKDYALKKIYLPIEDDYNKKGDRAHFLKAKITEEGVQLLTGQSSAMLFSFAYADALVYIPYDQMMTPKGSLVEVHLLP